MCGICGIMNMKGEPIDEALLRRMTDSLAHRGPDDSGIHIENGNGISVGLGHRRLSIIDLSEAGRQPMANEDGSVWIAYNGEVYNFPEIRKKIEPRHRFSSRTDTEVILHLYEEEGAGCLPRLNGMFGLAIWDNRRRLLTLARDRMGKKPLSYALLSDEIVFASELKALLLHPRISREIDPAALRKYLAYEYVPSPQSIIRGVRKLPPGYLLTYSADGSVSSRPFRDLDFGDGRNRDAISVQDAGDEVRSLLLKAVERRLVSDVPLGVFLSGGIDSSAVLAMMLRLRDPKDVKTFSIGFRERSFDESEYGRRMARHFGTDHHEEILDPQRMIEIFPEVAGFLDEPFADASIIPTYLLSRFTRRTVTVALGGDGGDELFAGYPTFPAHRLAGWYERLPSVLQRLAGAVVDRLPVSMANISFDFKAKQFLKGIPYPPEIRNQVWLGAFSPPEIDGVLTGDFRDAACGTDPYEDIRSCLDAIPSDNLWDRIAYLYMKFYLADDILTKVDRASMAVSLEVRAPFLDPDFVDFVNALPPDMKLAGFTTKYILKRALEGILPGEILHRGKKGFGMPVAWWLRNDLKGFMIELLDPKKIGREGMFRPEYVHNLIEEHLAGTRDNRKPLWTLMIFELWRRNYLD